MPRYQGEAQYAHDSPSTLGVLLVNLGTPDAPTPTALRRYLREFLSDPRVVEAPRWLWWLALHGVILRIRPPRAAKAYQSVWTPEGSPLLAISQRQSEALQLELERRLPGGTRVALAMRYGNPSVRAGLEALRAAGARRVLVFPLYPQYSATTTASVFDAVSEVLRGWRWLPELRFINHYHDDPGYIAALADSVRAYWAQHGRPDHLLMSFHGIPRRYLLAGDPYHCECHKTGRLLAEALALDPQAWTLTFQSRFGREEWLKPYTDHTLKALAERGVGRVDVVCPGFSADCLETLEEIEEQNREVFLHAGGQSYHYIPALNDSAAHIAALADLVQHHAQGWAAPPAEAQRPAREAARARALALGAER
ncbi:ferrochelatase [Ectothiorhodospiraceae bacterium 2226]|nr:ferrochelatase [Ectothiorhodospiraceae bacterium 2226]